MADNKGRLVYIEPNLFAAEALSNKGMGAKHGDGKLVNNITWNPEDLNIFVDLQAIVPSRSQCGTGQEETIDLSPYVSFLQGSILNKDKANENYLTTNYTEASYSEIAANKVSTTENLGISSIDIRFDAHFFPQVTMKFTDVRGYSLFMPAEEEYFSEMQSNAYKSGNYPHPGKPYTNLFKAVFHFPYPKFLLTVKGFYGNKVTFMLAVNEFKTALNGQNGNFDVTISFIGYMFGLYTDIPMNYIMIAPYIDAVDGQIQDTSYWAQQSSRFVSKTSNAGNDTTTVDRIPTFLELARSFAELNVTTDDVMGTATEDYNKIQTAINNLDEIIKEYNEAVKNFGKSSSNSTSKIYIASETTNRYNVYVLATDTEYDWDKDKTLKGLYDKITYYNSNVSNTKDLTEITISYPFLVVGSQDNISTLKSKDLTRLNISKTGEITYTGSENVFVEAGRIVTLEDLKKDSEYTRCINSLRDRLKDKDNDKQYTLVAFPGIGWINEVKSKYNVIKDKKEKKIIEATESAVSLYSEKLGYSLTIENVFRMLFAHIECFMHYYLNETIGNIKNSNRTFETYGLDPEFTDSDGISVTKKTFLAPFPALYSKDYGDNTAKLLYPGDEPNTIDMKEVEFVNRLHDAAKLAGEKAAEVAELARQNEEANRKAQDGYNENTSYYEKPVFPFNISFDGSFKPVSLTDAFCNNKNPYSYIVEHPEITNNPEQLLKEILYLAYLRYRIFTVSVKAMVGDYTKASNYFLYSELENIVSVFPNISSDTKNKLKEITSTTNKTVEFATNIAKGRIGFEGTDIYGWRNNKGYEPLCSGYDTTKYNTKNDKEFIKPYTFNSLRGLYVLPSSSFDIFNSINNSSVCAKNLLPDERKDTYNFNNLNTLYDFSEDLGRFDYDTIFGNRDVSLNSVYYLTEEQREQLVDAQENKKYGEAEECIVDSNDIVNNSDKDILKHDSIKSYYKFISQRRSTTEDYKGMYSPNALIVDESGEKFENLFLTKYFWDQSPEGQAFLLLSSFIASNENMYFLEKGKELVSFGVNAYRLRKLSVLYYGALIHRLRIQLTTGEDLITITKGDTSANDWAIDKDVFNEYVSEKRLYARIGVYYYPKDKPFSTNHRRYTTDAPILSLLSSKEVVPDTSSNITMESVYSKYVKDNKIYKDIIDIIDKKKGPDKYEIPEEITKSLKEILGNGDNEDDKYEKALSLEKYFVQWATEGEFKEFITLLKDKYVDTQNGNVEKTSGDIKSLWSRFKTPDGKETIPCFMYSEEEGSPNMFLNRLQCDQVTVFACIPKEKATLIDSHIKIIQVLLEKLNTYYNSVLTDKTDSEEATVTSDSESSEYDKNSLELELKKTTYYTLKSLFDKWMCGYGDFKRFELPTPTEEHLAKTERYERGTVEKADFKEMNNFLFVDSFYNDISDKFYCDPGMLYKLIMGILTGEIKYSIYQFMSKVAQDNKLLMKALPIYNNYYNVDTISEIFTPHNSYDTTDNTNDHLGFGSTYILMYTGEGAKYLNEESKSDIVYRDDGMDLGNTLGYITKADAVLKNFTKNGNTLEIPVPAFGVTYGMQNQQYFKGININMDNPITTDYGITNTLQISQQGAKGDKNFPMGIGQNIYAIYSNRSYTCTVEMMGCINIMPMMYFQLNNIPMFKGAYMIVNVSHSIKPGTMTTTFTGIRQSKYLYPLLNSNIILLSVLDKLNNGNSNDSSRISAVSKYEPVEGKLFTSSLPNLILDNALAGPERYPWKIKDGSRYPYRKRKKAPQHIILHYTAGVSSSQGAAGTLVNSWVKIWNNGGGGSADFGVDDTNIYQYVPNVDEWHATWCNGGSYKADGYGGRKEHDDAHLDGIGIEICSTHKKDTSFNDPNHDGWSFTPATLENASNLCAELIFHFETLGDAYGTSSLYNTISTHYRVSGKICPGIKGWNDAPYRETNGKLTGKCNNDIGLIIFVCSVYHKLLSIQEKGTPISAHCYTGDNQHFKDNLVNYMSGINPDLYPKYKSQLEYYMNGENDKITLLKECEKLF